MKQLFAYIRVSDPKQGKGVSLDEQRSIIDAYGRRIGVTITEWFMETRTAAKTGRPVFDRMVKLVRARKASGFIVHKLDRTTRNWYDWAEINDLLDDGVDIHVASDGVELRSNGSRLAADMEILVAVHYIRNLRQEALKGIHGRLQQGILPNAAPVGYLNCGAGEPKAIDPVKGPLVAKLFELYAGGGYSLRELTGEAARLGLRSRSGGRYSVQQVNNILRNPFYAGLIRSRRYGLFPGKHVPLVSPHLFRRVDAILTGKHIRRTRTHTFLFRRFIRCETCGRSLSASLKKGRVYYRCPTSSCPTTSIREDAIDGEVRGALRLMTLSADEATIIEEELATYFADEISLRESRLITLRQALAAADARLSRITDLLLDGAIDVPTHDAKRSSLILERQQLVHDIQAIEGRKDDFRGAALKLFELLKRPETLYELADGPQKRLLLEIVFSNSTAYGKSLVFAMHEPFATFANCNVIKSGGQFYDTDRTLFVRAIATCATESAHRINNAFEALNGHNSIATAA